MSLTMNVVGAVLTILAFVINPLLGLAAFCFFGIIAIRLANAERRR